MKVESLISHLSDMENTSVVTRNEDGEKKKNLFLIPIHTNPHISLFQEWEKYRNEA